MASTGYDPAYAAAKHHALDEQIKGLRSDIKALVKERDKYKADGGNAPAEDD